jgi:hypothetical protein
MRHIVNAFGQYASEGEASGRGSRVDPTPAGWISTGHAVTAAESRNEEERQLHLRAIPFAPVQQRSHLSGVLWDDGQVRPDEVGKGIPPLGPIDHPSPPGESDPGPWQPPESLPCLFGSYDECDQAKADCADYCLLSAGCTSWSVFCEHDTDGCLLRDPTCDCCVIVNSPLPSPIETAESGW